MADVCVLHILSVETRGDFSYGRAWLVQVKPLVVARCEHCLCSREKGLLSQCLVRCHHLPLWVWFFTTRLCFWRSPWGQLRQGSTGDSVLFLSVRVSSAWAWASSFPFTSRAPVVGMGMSGDGMSSDLQAVTPAGNKCECSLALGALGSFSSVPAGFALRRWHLRAEHSGKKTALLGTDRSLE